MSYSKIHVWAAAFLLAFSAGRVPAQTDPATETPPNAHRRAKDFPGAVPLDAPRVSKTVSIDVGTPGWHGTGLYAAPGETITVALPRNAADKGLRLRIGCHKDRLRDARRREPVITVSESLTQPSGTAMNPFGGLVYIEVPRDVALGSIEVKIENGVAAPHFILGTTTLDAWRSEIRTLPAPWAELETDKLILSVPSSVVRELDDPESLMKFWDEVMDAQATLAAIPVDRVRPERIVADIQISAGYMHAGYPIMIFLPSARVLVDLPRLKNNGHGDVWGFFHELGHNHQNYDWTFRGTGEVTVNLFSLYCMERACNNANPRREVTAGYRKDRLQRHVDGGAEFGQWQRDPFLALQMYMQLQEAFGWEPFQKTFAEYRELPQDERPRSDDAKRDQWLVRFSKTVGKDLGPFFENWGVPTSEAARASIADLPEWMPDDFPKPTETK